VAKAGDYPEWVGRTNGRGVPDRAVVVLGTVAALLAAVGGLTTLVEAASLVFLLTFSVVGAIAWRRRIGRRPVAAAGCLTAGAAALVLTGRLALEAPVALAALVAFVAVTLVAHSIARHTLSRTGGSSVIGTPRLVIDSSFTHRKRRRHPNGSGGRRQVNALVRGTS